MTDVERITARNHNMVKHAEEMEHAMNRIKYMDRKREVENNRRKVINTAKRVAEGVILVSTGSAMTLAAIAFKFGCWDMLTSAGVLFAASAIFAAFAWCMEG